MDKVLKTKCGSVENFKIEYGKVYLNHLRGMTEIVSVNGSCIKLAYTRNAHFSSVPSFAIDKAEDTPIKNDDVFCDGKYLFIALGDAKMKICLENSSFSIYNNEENAFIESDEGAFDWTKDKISIAFMAKENNCFYGLGEKTGQLNKKGRKYTMWNKDDSVHLPSTDCMYKSIPFLIHMKSFGFCGIFIDNPCVTTFDLCKTDGGKNILEAMDEQINLYFFLGSGLGDILKGYTELTGRMEMPPKWSLGYQQSRYSYINQDEVIEIAKTFRERNMPCDVIYMDIHYMDDYKLFTFSPERFPEPEKMIKELDKMGFKVVTIVDPGVKTDLDYEVFLDGLRENIFLKKADGSFYIGECWPGKIAFPDFTSENARKWWGKQHKALLDKGVSGIWDDMNEPSDFDFKDKNYDDYIALEQEVMFENDGHPASFKKYHNAFGHMIVKATFEGLKKINPNRRPFILSRAAFSGTQKFAAVWTGDNMSWWEHLSMAVPMLANLGLSGLAFAGTDIGGFIYDCPPELFTRWMQMGAFFPMCRAHTILGSKRHEPWSFGEKVESICRDYLKLRYRLMPYLYNCFYQTVTTGKPILRPLVFDFSHDEAVFNMNDQLMFGDDIMIAPVTTPGTRARSVYLPEGQWYDFHTEIKYEGNQYICAEAPLEKMPIFVRGGAIIPFGEDIDYTGAKENEKLSIVIYAGERGSLTLYEDSGEGYEYADGLYRMTKFSFISGKGNLELTVLPLHKDYLPCRESIKARVVGKNESISIKQSNTEQKIIIQAN